MAKGSQCHEPFGGAASAQAPAPLFDPVITSSRWRFRHLSRHRGQRRGGQSRSRLSQSHARLLIERRPDPVNPQVSQRSKFTSIGGLQSIQVLQATLRVRWSGLDMQKRELVQKGGKHSADAAIEIFERMNPLKTPIGPKQGIRPAVQAFFDLNGIWTGTSKNGRGSRAPRPTFTSRKRQAQWVRDDQPATRPHASS